RCVSDDLFWVAFLLDVSATASIYTLSLHDALPICCPHEISSPAPKKKSSANTNVPNFHNTGLPFPILKSLYKHTMLIKRSIIARSEEHTSELQSREKLVCRLLLEKKKIAIQTSYSA